MFENLPPLPSLIEVFFDPVSIILLSIYGILITWEAILPARSLPKIGFTEIINSMAFIAFFILSTLLPLLSDAYLSTFQLLDLNYLGTAGGAVLGIIIFQLGFYAWHRILHKNKTLWRTFHQMHHSSKRIDSFGAFFFNPIDIVGYTFLGSICLIVLTGFTPQASTIIILITTFLAIFQHSNVKTPMWIGYFIKRPESHSLHHEEEGHAHNYSSLTFIDMLFGTFKNPKNYIQETDSYTKSSKTIMSYTFYNDMVNE